MPTLPASAASPSTTVELVLVNNSQYAFSFTPQTVLITPAANGSATLNAGSTPIVVAAGASSTAVSVTLAPQGQPVTVTLELDGTIGTSAFSLIQVFGVDGSQATPTAYNLPATWPLASSPAPALASSPASGAYQLTLTISADLALLPPSTFTVEGTQVLMNGSPFFACGVDYSPTPVGGATDQPGVGDWFTPPWWTGNSPDIGSRDLPLLKAAGANAVRTYFAWYWLKDGNLDYLQGITQTTPMTTYTAPQYPYTAAFDHLPFLDSCHANGIYVMLGIAVEGGNCFNFDTPSVSAAYQNFYLQTAQKLATLYGQHPAVLGFCMGNEQNNALLNVDSRTWLYYQSMYQAIKAAAPGKLVTIAFQDDQTLYNGTLTVTDQANQNPPTAFNNLPIEQAVSMVVDVWGLNIYAGITTDFPVYQTNVVQAAKGAYARPLLVTEWGTPAGQNTPSGAVGPTAGNAQGQQLPAASLVTGAAAITAAVATMQDYLSFIAGAFYFEFSDEWWKNTGFNTALVDTAVSPLIAATQQYQTNADGQVTMLDGSLLYPAYPFTHDGSQNPDWPEEWWGLYAIAVSNARQPFQPDPANPDTLTARDQYVQALKTAYGTIGAAYQAACNRNKSTR